MRKGKIPANSPSKRVVSVQYDLFRQFITNDESEVSNTVEVWESIPKYFFTPSQVNKLRTAAGHANPHTFDFDYNGLPCSVRIQPALMEQKDGSFQAFFPGVTEELIEESLKKIFTDQQFGTHNAKNLESWVRFSLRMVQSELSRRGRTRSIPEISHAIEVMSGCVLTLFKDGKELWKGAVLQDVVTVGREEYLADSTSHHVARLPLFLSKSINDGDYRQFNLDSLMSLNSPLARWIKKRLLNRWRQAGYDNSYHFLYSDLKNSGLLQQATEDRNRTKVSDALRELIEKNVLSTFEQEQRKEGRRIVDVKYIVRAHRNFVQEQKAANKRESLRIIQGGVGCG